MVSRPPSSNRVLTWALLPLVLLLTVCTKTEETPPPPATEPAPGVAAPTELDLWAGVPPLAEEPGDLSETIEPRPGPAKPKTVGERIELPFEPKKVEGGPVVPPGTKLEVERYGPVGAEGLVGAVRVAFNQPMVPLASVESLKAKPIPLTIDPMPPGQARWLGTQVMAWEPEGRMPFSTTYEVTVPAGVKAVSGETLDKAVSWTFSTPTLALESISPYDGSTHVALSPTITLVFNQPIEKTALTGALSLRGKGSDVALTAVPAAKIEASADESVVWREKRTLRLQPKTTLAANTTYTLKLPAGTFGEGPDKSAPIVARFTTYPPLRVSWPGCGGSPCWSTSGIQLQATNRITDAKIESKVHVTPAVDEMTVNASWNGISIGGRFDGGGKYTVTVDAGVVDVYGQTLASPFKKTITLGPPYPQLSAKTQTKSPGVIERAGSKEIKLAVAGLSELEVEAVALASSDIGTALKAYPERETRAWPSTLPATSYTDTLDVSATLKRPDDFTVDLAKVIEPGRNAVWLNVRSEEVTRHGWKQRLGYHNLFEITDLGVAAALDRGTGLVQVTTLSDGAPVAGAKLTIHSSYSPSGTLWKGTTDADGLATPDIGMSSRPGLLVVETADDFAFARLDNSDLRGRWGRTGSNSGDEPRLFIYTDRTPYKPGDTIHLSGIVRKETRGPTGGVDLWATDFTAPYVVNDPRGIEVAKGDLRIGKFGTFSVDIETDPDGGTGDYRLDITFGGFLSADRHFYHSIPVETYRTPEFKVSVERGEATPLVYGDTLVAEVIGEYMHGAPLVGGNVAWSLTRSETGFTPPGDANRDFHFGAQRSYGFGRYGLGHFRGGGAPSGTNLLSGAGALDGLGKLKIEKELLAVEPNPAAPKPDPSAPKVEPPPPAAATYSINATVTDDNRQAIAGSGSFVVHPAAVYVGLRSERTVLKEGERAELSAVLVDLDGARVTGRDIALTLVRKETTRTPVEKNGRWVFEYDTKEIEEGACPLSASSAPASCELTVGTAGTYLVRGTATDDKGNEAFSETTIYVHGKDAVVWEDNQHRIDLVPDKDKYSPGDTATILLRSPFEEARGVVIVEREGISKQVPVHLQGGSHVVEIPVDDTMIPTVTVSAMLTRGREKVTGVPSGQDLGRPAAATGRLELAVDDAAKRIVVDLTPSAERIAPGGKLNLSIKTHTAAGDATNAAVAVMVVDEGVLSLLGHETPDPLPFFHHARSNDVWMYALQASVMGQAADVIAAMAVGNDDEDVWGGLTGTEVGEAYGVGGLGLVGTGRGGGGTGVGTIGLGANKDKAKKPRPARARSPMAPPAPGAAPAAEESEKKAEGGDFARSLDPSAAMAQPVSLRDVFATTAYFNGEVLTDEHGMANVEIAMPENLTTFRIMAVAVDPDHADHFGNGETTVTVRKPIMVRPSLPRFANFGDRFEASVMVDNLTEDPQNILVGTRGLNVELSGSEEKFVEVPAGESREVRFSMAAKEVGRMRLQFAVMSNAGRDATEVTVPVHYPATAKAFADYGAIDATTQRVLEPPADALPDFGGLEVSMSSTALSGLEGAVEYLINYEYECAEQTASRILPIFALGDIIQEFPIATVSDRDKRDLLANDGIKKLLDRQNYDGGFRYWERGDSWPYLTNWVVLALLEGKRQGYKVDADALNNALNYVENFVRYGHDTRWGRYYDWTSRAFGLWLLSGEGRGKDLFEKVWGHRKDLPFYARAQMMAVAHRFGKTKVRDEIRKELDDAVVESAKAIHFIERTTEADADGLSLLMHSSVQTDAIVMMALLETAPTDTTLPKIMAGIMADRDPSLGGRWGSTHANAWALLGASRYYESVEATEPDFVARIWIDDDFGGEQSFKGRSMTTVDQTVAMKSILGAAQREVTLEKDGPGKLYYRLGLRYAPKDLKLPADDQGFEVYREYEALPDAAGKVDPEAVKRAEDGSWVVKGGTDLRVTIHVVARDRASYVVVDDALPAGFEGQNPRFLTSGARPAAASRTVSPTRWWWPWWQFDHTDLRDDRMLLFADFMPAGVYTYSYTARATTLGTFHLPPIKAEAMYEPERYGHSASSEVRVVE